MRGIKFMKIFAIIDEETTLLTGILLYYEKEGTCVIELPEYLDEWTAPLLFTSYVKKKIYTIPRDISFLWVKERVIPSGRQNINDILAHHNIWKREEKENESATSNLTCDHHAYHRHDQQREKTDQ